MMDQETSEMDISSLPPEIIVHIFEFLPLRDRLAAAVTCKEWYHLAFSPTFCKNMIISFNGHCRLTAFREIPAYRNCRNAFVFYDIIKSRENPEAIDDLFRSAPLEWLRILGYRDTIKSFLNDVLPCMDMLTALFINTNWATEDILTIKHPTLKSIAIVSCSGCENFEIICPSLNALKVELGSKKCFDVVVQLQQQLQCLEISCFKNHEYATLANMKLNNLKTLKLQLSSDNRGIQLSFKQMVNLQELYLKDVRYDVKVGEELGALKNLAKLSLVKLVVNTTGLAKALRYMVELKDLHLDECIFTPYFQPCHLVSEHVRNVSLKGKKDFAILLPNCKKLKSLTLAYIHKEIDDIFQLVCDLYPELEHLNFGVLPGMLGVFHSPASFSSIKKLKLLRNLHFTRLYLHGMNWADCSSIKIEKLQLEACAIGGTGAQKMVESLGHGLRQLLIDSCYLQQPRADVFDIDENCVEGLRKRLSKCKISYCDCHIESLHEICGERRMLPA